VEQKPTEVLEGEHRAILKIVGVMAGLAENLAAGRPVEADTLRGIVGFMRTYADKCHHGKEEAHLFTLLEAKGVPTEGCPLGALRAEHQMGRDLVRALAEKTEAYAAAVPAAAEALEETLHGLIALYPSHIWKEDYLLFPMSDHKILSSEEQGALYERFEAVDQAMGRGLLRQLEELPAQLQRQLQGA